MNLPNKISVVRICMIPVFVLFFFLDVIPFNHIIVAVIFALAALTDALDGHIARSRNLVTNLGKFLDPIADKVLVATAFILMLTEYSIFGLWGNWIYIAASVCICVILARELIISAFRQIAASAGIVLAAEKLGKYKTTFQDGCIFFSPPFCRFFRHRGTGHQHDRTRPVRGCDGAHDLVGNFLRGQE